MNYHVDMSAGKALAIGSAFFTTGAGISAAFAVFNVQAKGEFWTLPVVLGAALTAVGLVILIHGALTRDHSSPGPQIVLKQRVAKGSHNFQAGGNLTVGDRDKS